MKTMLIVLLSGLALWSYSQEQVSSVGPAIDRVQAGKDTAWLGGYVLHVTKRDGAALEGIQLANTNVVIRADSGTVSIGSLQNTTDAGAITLTLENVTINRTNTTGFTVSTVTKAAWVLHE